MAKPNASKPDGQAGQQGQAQPSQQPPTQQSQQPPAQQSQQAPTQQSQQAPTQQSQQASTQYSPEASKLLAILSDLFSSVPRQPPNVTENRKAVQEAVDKFNIILGGLELKPPSSTQGPAPAQSPSPNQVKAG